MTKFTKERLEQYIKSPLEHGLTRSEQMEMARQLLASIEQEPVAYAPKGHIDRYLRGDNSGCWVYGHPVSDDDERLYRASQISPFDRRAIASKVQGLCSRLPGATFANAAEFTLDEIEAPTGQEEPVSQSFKFLTLEHIRVIEMLLSVCGAAFELADDSCQQQIDGEDCRIVPDTSFAKLSDTLDEIEDTLPYELPNTILQWAAIPRYALRGILYAAPQLPQPAVVDEWRMMCGEWRDETVSIHDDSGLIVSGISPNAAGIIIEAHNACRAAMLQGAEPVATVYKLPFEQWLSQQTGTIDVECGCVMTEVFYHWLRVAYEAGNSPLIHDGWVAVPVEPTEEMIEATFAGEMELQSVQHQVRNRERRAHYYRAMLAAAPQQEAE